MNRFSAWSESDYEEEEDNQPFRRRIQRKGVGIIEIDYHDDEMVMWCPHCASYGFRVRLGPKILMPGQKREPDYDQWLQCPDCFEVVATYVVENDAVIIRDDIPTVETPFENTTEIIGVPSRTSRQGQKAAAKRKRDRTKLDDDPEIDSLLKIYGDRVKVLK
jgi:hypothetical protein